MRAYIDFKLDKELTIPTQYNHIVQAVILKWLGDDNYSKFLHDCGYEYNNRRYKLYTFSRLQGNFKINRQSKMITYYDNARLVVSSSEDKFIEYLVNTFLGGGKVKIGRNEVEIASIRSQKYNYVPEDMFYTLSPIVAYSTLYDRDKKKTYYYSPYETEFEELIRKNLIKKYAALYDKLPEDDSFTIKPLQNNRLKENIVIYRETVIKGWSGEFLIKGSDELLNIAYDSGLGSKNSQGFGCIESKK